MNAVIKSAYLRVYLPQEGVPKCEPHPTDPVERTRRWEPYGFIGESMIDDAWMAEWRGRAFVCPRRPHLRMLEGVLALYRAFESWGRPLIIPEDVARQANRELEDLRRRDPEIRSYILTSAWHVPVRWFVIFDHSERLLNTSGLKTELRYRTSLGEATARIDRAVEILNNAEMPDAIVTELAALGAWLADFPSDAMIELDYAGIIDLFAEADLILDDSAAEVWSSIEALEAGDWDQAGEHYGALMARWAPIFAVTYSN
jgi:hypothetical protein